MTLEKYAELCRYYRKALAMERTRSDGWYVEIQRLRAENAILREAVHARDCKCTTCIEEEHWLDVVVHGAQMILCQWHPPSVATPDFAWDDQRYYADHPSPVLHGAPPVQA
jgi:hypothetical protein